jgi:hypothetical protein
MTRWRSRSKLRCSPARLDSDRRFGGRYPIAAIRFAGRSDGHRPQAVIAFAALFDRLALESLVRHRLSIDCGMEARVGTIGEGESAISNLLVLDP